MGDAAAKSAEKYVYSKEEWLESLLLRRISAGYWAVGERLPAERKMAAELDVSRNTLRGALRRLEARGLIEARQGSGYYLQSTCLMTSSNVSPAEESDERIMARLEAAYLFLPGVVAMAACKITDVQLAELEECTANLSKAVFSKDISEFKAQARRFFKIIAGGTKNQIIDEMVSSFCASSSLMFPGFSSFEEAQQQKLFADYVLIFNALKKRDSEESSRCVKIKVINTCVAFSELKGVALPFSIEQARQEML
ncbi:DNA-binding transcriptional regulator, FadR family [Malonomonas rubra DSM 5091]|uniref:DNA-binding transcriptional regulator, FadR family n=2 Tax=Malonomonas rubra TaxID=57040 RepID=A0A1M6JBY9_MALRU|nr:DNA-binding transcriptional regulator, FadR family [Malonomonas rubra DSM 5091]